MSKASVKWVKDLLVEGQSNHNVIPFDSRYKDHQQREGSAPTNVFLMSIVGCSIMGTVFAMDKNNIKFEGVDANIEALYDSTVDIPYNFTLFRIEYHFTGVKDVKGAIESVEMSHDKYCPMIYMAKKIAPVQYEIWFDGELQHKSANWVEKQISKCTGEICDSYYAY